MIDLIKIKKVFINQKLKVRFLIYNNKIIKIMVYFQKSQMYLLKEEWEIQK